ncbi:nucleotidyl transferase AbiEii/AbiGii toxin family protein [Pengzhenrongella sp.]|uniref:nucleotidyl transferase AbiEii/AbiGii toxin family protein n=1 Tax=Pengzhenrongella sp. TaxID=2888820 RepID=UPI002F95271C
MQRLLARVAAVAAPDSWALKGGLAMIAQVGEQARATADADATWRPGVAALTRIPELATELDLGDHFEFTVAAPATMQAEGPEHGLRFAVEARLAGRLFERLRLDLSIVSDDPRPVDVVHLRNLFEFAGFDAVTVPAIRTEQQLAEKAHAYTRVYASGENSRAKDLYDMLVIAEQLLMSTIGDLRDPCRTTYALRSTPWPPILGPPPSTWISPWNEFVSTYGIRFKTLDEAYQGLHQFWAPVLDAGPQDRARWDSYAWAWAWAWAHPATARVPTGASTPRRTISATALSAGEADRELGEVQHHARQQPEQYSRRRRDDPIRFFLRKRSRVLQHAQESLGGPARTWPRQPRPTRAAAGPHLSDRQRPPDGTSRAPVTL